MLETLGDWCALWRASGVGVNTFSMLLATFESPSAFFECSETEIAAHLGTTQQEKWRQWHQARQQTDWQQDIEWWQADTKNRHILTLHDARYPALLREIADPPPLLFVQGNPDCLSAGQIAIVGSRHATPTACQSCTDIVAQLGKQGLVITSGLALGIDGCAHQAALSAGAQTIAVVGTGLDRVYPARHRELAHHIATQGALVSEFSIGTGVRQSHFPRRNRIISGLSLGVFVVEASIQSGSLITARQAAEQGREVFAMPGSIYNPLAKGCHQLIRQGAKLVEQADDILEELLPLAQAGWQLQQTQQMDLLVEKAVTNAELSTEQQLILSAMGFDPCRVDDLVERTQLTSEQISAMLLILELDGHVQTMPGGRYQRTGN